MKKIYFFLVSVALFVSGASASAQFVNQNGGSRASSSAADVEDVFNTFDFTYSPLTFKQGDDNNTRETDMNAVSLNWAQVRAITPAYPIYLQYGVGLQYSWDTETDSGDDYDYEWSTKATTSFLTAVIPVNVMYCFNVPQTSIALMPYAGINLQGHIIGQYSSKTTYDGETETNKINFFSKDDMGEEGTYNRFGLGWQIGAKVAYNNYFFGIAYQGPITSLYKQDEFKLTTSQVNISVGIKF